MERRLLASPNQRGLFAATPTAGLPSLLIWTLGQAQSWPLGTPGPGTGRVAHGVARDAKSWRKKRLF